MGCFWSHGVVLHERKERRNSVHSSPIGYSSTKRTRGDYITTGTGGTYESSNNGSIEDNGGAKDGDMAVMTGAAVVAVTLAAAAAIDADGGACGSGGGGCGGGEGG